MPKVARLKKSRNRRKKAGTKKRIHIHTRKYMHGGDITKYCWKGFFPALFASKENTPFSIWCKANSEEEARQKLYSAFEYFTNTILEVINDETELLGRDIRNIKMSDLTEIQQKITALYDNDNNAKDLFNFNQYENRHGRERFVGIDMEKDDTEKFDMNKYNLNNATLTVEDDSDADKITFRQLLATEPTAC